MAIISRIRKRAGLLVGIIAVALFSFVLGDMFFSGQSLFSDDQNAGEIAGKSIGLIPYDNEVQRIAEIVKERNRQAALDERTMSSIRNEVWTNLVTDMALMPQFQSAGIMVSNAEMKDLMIGEDPHARVVEYFSDPNSGKLIDYFRDPITGKLKGSSVKTYVDSLPPQERQSWIKFEEILRKKRTEEKYMNLIKKGLFVTTSQAKAEYDQVNRTVSFKYAMKPYTSISDSAVKVDEQDLLKYYNANSYKFKQEASRKLEYVIFDIKPSQEDYNAVKSQVDKLAAEWSTLKSLKDDSMFVVAEAESRFFDTTHYGKGNLAPQIDSIAHAAEEGTILPAYMENNSYKLCKVLDHMMTPDSVKARHILIKATAGDSVGLAKAKSRIDSIKSVIQKKKNFEEMAKKFSEDNGSRDTGGVLGWFTLGKMVPEFQSACFYGKKGEMPVVKTTFGYHLIEIQDQSPLTIKTSVATVDLPVEPGTKTRQMVYNQATEFLNKCHQSESFAKAAEASQLIPRLADPLKETDEEIAGLENARDLIRWAFTSEKGAITNEPYAYTNKYVIAVVSEVREKGIAPMEQKKDEVQAGAIKMKKAEMIIEEMKKANAKVIEDYASKMNLQIVTGEGAAFASYSIPNIGRELNVYGPLFTLKSGQLSNPIIGETGVYVVKVEKITEAPATADYSASRTQAANNYMYRVDGESIEALKKKADIKDFRAKFY